MLVGINPSIFIYMKKLFLIISCLIGLGACVSSGSESAESPTLEPLLQRDMLLIIRSSRGLPKTVKKAFTYTSEQISPDRYKLTYADSNRTTVYYFSTQTGVAPEKWVDGTKIEDEFDYVDMELIDLDLEFFPVYKFAQNYSVFDGCINLYWSPDYGIILERNPDWRNYGIYVPNDIEDMKESYFLLGLSILNLEDFGHDCIDYDE